MRAESRKHNRGYVRSTWYNARRVTRLLSWESWNGRERTRAADTPEATLADILQQPYIRERTTAARCACGRMSRATMPDASVHCPDCHGSRVLYFDLGRSTPCPRCRTT